MKTSIKIIITAAVLLALDLILTFYFISNYYHIVDEGNPLIYVDNGIWVILLNIVYFAVIVIFSKTLDKYKTINIKSDNVFVYIKKLYKSDHYNFIFISIIFAFIYSTLISRLIVVIDWIVFGFYKNNFFNTSYYKFRDLMPLNRFDIIIGLFSFFILIPLWYIIEYKRMKKNEKIT